MELLYASAKKKKPPKEHPERISSSPINDHSHLTVDHVSHHSQSIFHPPPPGYSVFRTVPNVLPVIIYWLEKRTWKIFRKAATQLTDSTVGSGLLRTENRSDVSVVVRHATCNPSCQLLSSSFPRLHVLFDASYLPLPSASPFTAACERYYPGG